MSIASGCVRMVSGGGKDGGFCKGLGGGRGVRAVLLSGDVAGVSIPRPSCTCVRLFFSLPMVMLFLRVVKTCGVDNLIVVGLSVGNLICIVVPIWPIVLTFILSASSADSTLIYRSFSGCNFILKTLSSSGLVATTTLCMDFTGSPRLDKLLAEICFTVNVRNGCKVVT